MVWMRGQAVLFGGPADGYIVRIEGTHVEWVSWERDGTYHLHQYNWLIIEETGRVVGVYAKS